MLPLFIGAKQLILFLIVAVFFLLLPLIALIEVLQHEYSRQYKLIWELTILFFPVVGAILYFVMGRKHKLKGE